MKYSDSFCPICQNALDNEYDVVVCPVCGTPHHRECFKNNGHCANDDKHAEGFVWSCEQESSKPIETASVQEPAEEDVLGIICPRCGDNCPKDLEICPNCGQKLSETPQENNFNSFDNLPFGGAATVISPTDTIDDIPVEEIARYIRFAPERYILKFFKMEKLKKKFMWNWGAFLETLIFNPYWFFKKKLYGAGIIFGSIYLALNAVLAPVRTAFNELYTAYYPNVLDAIETYGSSSTQAMDALNVFVGQVPVRYLVVLSAYFAAVFILSIVAGIIGNTLYKKKMKRDVLSARQEADDVPTYHLLLEKKGGSAFFLALLVWLLVRAIINFAFIYIPNFLI